MKQLIIIIAALTISSGLFAQDKTDNMKMTHKKTTTHHPVMKDCVMMKDGKMMMMKNGKMMDMDKDMTMSDGTVCMKDGNCRMKNGKMMMMKEGDKCYMNGKMGKMKMDNMSKMKM